MTYEQLWRPLCCIALLTLYGCDAAHLFGADDHAAKSRYQAKNAAAPTGSGGARSNKPLANAPAGSAAASPPSHTLSPNPDSIRLIGLDEKQVRSLFGSPTVEEEVAPGKTWRYRDGQCRLDLSLYPDVQTRVYRTLAYEVTSNDNSAEGKRLCVVGLQSRGRGK